jgi:hypothetical protein
MADVIRIPEMLHHIMEVYLSVRSRNQIRWCSLPICYRGSAPFALPRQGVWTNGLEHDISPYHNATIHIAHNRAISISLPKACPYLFYRNAITNAQVCGPALITSSVASSEYFLKFSLNSSPNLVTSPLKSVLPVQLFLGLSSSSGTFVHCFGTWRLKTS